MKYYVFFVLSVMTSTGIIAGVKSYKNVVEAKSSYESRVQKALEQAQ